MIQEEPSGLKGRSADRSGLSKFGEIKCKVNVEKYDQGLDFQEAKKRDSFLFPFSSVG